MKINQVPQDDDRNIRTELGEPVKVENICCLCGKEFEGMGNNALPLKDGRCCNDCNMNKVVPARLENHAYNSLSYAKNTALQSDIDSDKVFFDGLRIPSTDRLKNYQLVMKYWRAKMGEEINEDDLLQKETMVMLRALWRRSFGQSMEEAKVFQVEDEVVPLLLNTESDDGQFPFPSVFIDATVQIKGRTYYGFHIGSYYNDKIKYKGILTVYSKYVEHRGEKSKLLVPEFFAITKEGEELDELPDKKDYFHRKIKHFIFSFCNFINEPDVSVISNPLNPSNNKRRIERRLMPLPEFRRVTIHGKLRIYVDRIREWQGGTHAPIGYRFWVRGFYRHFRDKKRYASLYALDEDDKRKAGLTWSDKYDGILRVWVKPFIKGQGILIKQSWEVKE